MYRIVFVISVGTGLYTVSNPVFAEDLLNEEDIIPSSAPLPLHSGTRLPESKATSSSFSSSKSVESEKKNNQAIKSAPTSLLDMSQVAECCSEVMKDIQNYRSTLSGKDIYSVSQIVKILKAIQQENAFLNTPQLMPVLTGFLTASFMNDKGEVQKAIIPFLKDPQFSTIIGSALSLSGREEAYLANFSKQAKKEQISFPVPNKNDNPLFVKALNTVNDIHLFWGAFYASGDKIYLKKMIDRLETKPVLPTIMKKTIEENFINGQATDKVISQFLESRKSPFAGADPIPAQVQKSYQQRAEKSEPSLKQAIIFQKDKEILPPNKDLIVLKPDENLSIDMLAVPVFGHSIMGQSVEYEMKLLNWEEQLVQGTQSSGSFIAGKNGETSDVHFNIRFQNTDDAGIYKIQLTMMPRHRAGAVKWENRQRVLLEKGE